MKNILKENQSETEIETLEKQRAKKPVFFDDVEDEEIKNLCGLWKCPVCERIWGDDTLKGLFNYCPECGQKLDWT